MLLDYQLVPQTIVRPNSFTGLMSLYESNYLRLLQLIPEIERLDGCFRSKVAGECDLHVEILERCRYTVTLSLTYHFDTEQGGIANPDMIVRVYLDGALAESMSVGSEQQHERLRELVSSHRGELDARWKRNIILNKWLEYLSDQGHLILER
ncbi:MAG: DUF1249 domain-containing protein [Woeseiaceae bacterium]